MGQYITNANTDQNWARFDNVIAKIICNLQ